MCTNQTWIRNKFVHYPILVKCGKCPACKQEKANKRAGRIKHSYGPDDVCFFVQLDYENRFIPYVKKSELKNFLVRRNGLPSFFHIYRDSNFKYISHFASFQRPKKRGKGFTKEYLLNEDGDRIKTSYRKYFNVGRIASFVDFDPRLEDYFFDLVESSLDSLSFLRKKVGPNQFSYLHDKVGVLFYKDVQDFFKRLRISLFNKGFDGKFKYFVCGEYGTEQGFLRPHFHVLLFFDRRLQQIFTDAICESWKFCDISKSLSWQDSRRKIQIARDAASYVSSYVNCSSNVPPLLQMAKIFRPLWHYSQGFGMDFKEFSFPSILEKYRRRNFFYTFEVFRKGCRSFQSLPLPQYVLSRYFPRFKGYSRLTRPEIQLFVGLALEKSRQSLFDSLISHFSYLEYSSDDLHKIVVCIRNKFYFAKKFGVTEGQFITMYSDIWAIRASNILKFYRLYTDVPLTEQFDNIASFYLGDIKHAYLDSELHDLDFTVLEHDPNCFNTVIDVSQHYTDLYNSRVKERHYNNVFYKNYNHE